MRTMAILIALAFIPASALHYDRDAIQFTTLDELLSSGKELKVWSDTSIRILGISFMYRVSGLSWQYKANKSIPCTLSVGDTLALTIHASYIRSAENPAVDSLAIATGPGIFNYMPLHVGAFPHSLVTTNTITGPSFDTAGKSILFGRDSVYCTLRHQISYAYIWDDGFQTPWMDTRTAFHSWSVPRQYSIRTIARCYGNLFPDTSQPFSMTIAPTAVSASAGAYKSGFYTRIDEGSPGRIDFSQGADTSHDSDVVFDFRNGYSLIARYGLISLGLFDSLPSAGGGCTGFIAETSAVCRTYKSTFDSLVGSLHIICPVSMPDTGVRMNVGQFCLIKTKEGHCAILIKTGEYIGGIDREYFYWGYQSDGNRMFSPGTVSGLNNKLPCKKSETMARIKVREQGDKIQIALPRDRSTREIAIYKCDGSLLYRRTIASAKCNSIEPPQLPKGFYILLLQTEKEKIRQRLYVY